MERRVRPRCRCLEIQSGYPFPDQLNTGLKLHTTPQDRNCLAWQRLLDVIETAAEDGREEFAPGKELDWGDWRQIVTLPPTIGKLKSVKRLTLYSSFLLRIPPEIGEMTSLDAFDPYQSHRLHWFPYEITRCPKLTESRVSTRAIYGNEKNRMPFPRLPNLSKTLISKTCSICDGPFKEKGPLQAWISLWVATDVMPLLVNACSEECLGDLPTPPRGYIQRPHRGGIGASFTRQL